jgi:hypothetical protein
MTTAAKTFTAAVTAFEKTYRAELTDADLIALVTLKAIAKQLDSDDDLTPSLLGQFGLTFRSLQKRLEAKGGDDEPDELESLLTR